MRPWIAVRARQQLVRFGIVYDLLFLRVPGELTPCPHRQIGWYIFSGRSADALVFTACLPLLNSKSRTPNRANIHRPVRSSLCLGRQTRSLDSALRNARASRLSALSTCGGFPQPATHSRTGDGARDRSDSKTARPHLREIAIPPGIILNLKSHLTSQSIRGRIFTPTS